MNTSFVCRFATAVSAFLVSTCVWAQAVPEGDTKRGEEAYSRLCIGCHSIEDNRIGPKHRGIVGRRVGSVEGFKYSAALSQSTLIWDATLLDRWLADPEATIKGQRMGFRVNSRQTRGDLIAYLTSQNEIKSQR